MNSRKWYIHFQNPFYLPCVWVYLQPRLLVSGFWDLPLRVPIPPSTSVILSSVMLMIPFWLRAFSEMQAQKSQKSILQKGFPGGPSGKESTCQCRRCKRRMSCIQINCLIPELGRSLTVENEVATHSSILAWKIPWMEEPDGHN